MQWIFFVIVTLVLVIISRHCLLHPHSHGFYRFFVFEGVAALVIIQQPFWFVNPFSALQLVSWLLLLCSIILVVAAVGLLRRVGGRGDREGFVSNFTFENTVELVDTGLYGYIRHPMYASLLYLALGAFLKNIDWLSFFLVSIISVALVAAAKVEERENEDFFGDKYIEYKQRTRMFVPWIL